jgi:hypothetical protein
LPNRSCCFAEGRAMMGMQTAPDSCSTSSGQIGRRIAGGGHRHLPFMKSWRGTPGVGARIAELVCVDHEPLASVVEKQQADCDSGAGHLLAIIKPKIVRHTIILSTNNLFLLTTPAPPSGRLANPAATNLSIRSSRSPPSTFRVISTRSMQSLMIFQHDR